MLSKKINLFDKLNEDNNAIINMNKTMTVIYKPESREIKAKITLEYTTYFLLTLAFNNNPNNKGNNSVDLAVKNPECCSEAKYPLIEKTIDAKIAPYMPYFNSCRHKKNIDSAPNM